MTDKDRAEKKDKKERIPRQAMPEQEPRARVTNFDEVPLGYSPETAMLEARRCIQCKKPGGVSRCPVDIDIPGFGPVDLVAGVRVHEDEGVGLLALQTRKRQTRTSLIVRAIRSEVERLKAEVPSSRDAEHTR